MIYSVLRGKFVTREEDFLTLKTVGACSECKVGNWSTLVYYLYCNVVVVLNIITDAYACVYCYVVVVCSVCMYVEVYLLVSWTAATARATARLTCTTNTHKS